MNIILTGFKSCGKSTVGPLLAKRMNLAFIDTDSILEENFFQRFGLKYTCRQIYEEKGAATMRVLETECLAALAGAKGYVIATGGGILLQPENIALLKKVGLCVFLDVPLELIERRLAGQKSPLFTQKSVAEVFAERYPLYKDTADIHYAVGLAENPGQISKKIFTTLAGKKYGQ